MGHLDGAFALLIGCGEHVDSRLPAVPAVTTTVADLAEAFVERCGLAPDRVLVLLDPRDPTAMGQAVLTAAREAGSVLIVYYVGHGLLNQRGDLFLAARSTDPAPDSLVVSGFAYRTLREVVQNSGARTLVVILDCCYSGRATGTLTDTVDGEQRLMNLIDIVPAASQPVSSTDGSFVLTAAGRDELALAPPGARHTTFSGFLLSALVNGIPGDLPQLTLSAITDHLRHVVPSHNNAPRPTCRVSGNAGSLVLAPNPAYRGDDAPGAPWSDATAPAGRQCPYLGLTPFGQADSARFFGRERLLDTLLQQLANRCAEGGPLVVFGASGAGKSSLLRAGLLPAIQAGRLPVAGSAEWSCLSLTPTEDPLGTLAVGVAALTGTDPASLVDRLLVDSAELGNVLRRQPAGPGGGVGADGRGTAPSGRRVVLVIDQFEDLFADGTAHDTQRAYVRALCAAAHGGESQPSAVVVLGVRADFFGRCADFPELVPVLQRGQVVVGAMNTHELRTVIERPAVAAGLSLQDGLTSLLLRDLGAHDAAGNDQAYEPGRLPLLSHALFVTWQHRHGTMLTIAGYEKSGGLRQAIAVTAEAAYRRLDRGGQDMARRLLLRLVRLGDGTGDTRRTVSRDRLLAELPDPGLGARVIDLFAGEDARLLTVDESGVRITHDALLSAWPKLRAWIDADRPGLLIAQQLTEAAETWVPRRDDADLYRGNRLALATDWAQLHPELVGALAAEFLAQSRAAHDRRVADVDRRRAAALSEKMAVESLALRPADPVLAAQLSAAAYQLAPTAAAVGSLLSTTATPHATRLTTHSGSVYVALFTPDGRTLVTGGTDGRLALWEVTDQHRPRVIATLQPGIEIATAALHPGGHALVTAGAETEALLWDLTAVAARTGGPAGSAPVARLVGHTAGIRGVAWSPDGRTVVTASYDRTARLWDVTDIRQPVPLAELSGHTDGLVAVFHPHASAVVTASGDRSIRVWDITDRRRPTLRAAIDCHDAQILSAAVSADGRLLATGSFDNTVQLWDVSDPWQPRRTGRLAGHTNGVVALDFTADGRTLATGSYDHTVRFWDTTEPQTPSAGATLSGHSDTVYMVRFHPGQRALASASRDSSVRLWHLDGSILAGHQQSVAAVAFRPPDGRFLVTTSHCMVRLWDLVDPCRPAALATLRDHENGVLSAAISDDGRLLATASLDRTMRLWGLADPRTPLRLATVVADPENLFAIALTGDGNTAATGGADQVVRLWDTHDPRHPRLLTELPRHRDRVLALAFSPDGGVLAVGAGDTVRLWALGHDRRPTAMPELFGHRNSVTGLAFQAAGRLLASSSADHTARLWDLSGPGGPSLLSTLTGHSAAVHAVAISPDGATVATAGYDGTVALWDLADPADPRVPTRLAGHANRVNCLAFHPVRPLLASGASDVTARLWDLDVERVAARLQDTTGPLTEEHRRRYLPDSERPRAMLSAGDGALLPPEEIDG